MPGEPELNRNRTIGLRFLFMAFVLAAGCAQRGETCGQMSVLYATDRDWTGKAGEYFGGGRTSPTFGAAQVGVLTQGRPTPSGFALNRPHTVPVDRSGLLQEPDRINGEAMLHAIQDAIKVAPKKEILVFVHGFNVPY
jgi:esterase/lipase superfamily enzyme